MTNTLPYVSPETLINDFLHVAHTTADMHTPKYKNLIDPDDILSLCYEALINSANNWNAYCEKKGFSALDIHYFGYYASRRMKGMIQDEARKKDYVSRGGREWLKQDVNNTVDKLPTKFTRREIVSIDGEVDLPENAVTSDHEVTLALMVDATIKTLQSLPRAYSISFALNYADIKDQSPQWASIRSLAAIEITQALTAMTEVKSPKLRKLSDAQQKAKNKIALWESDSYLVDDDLYFVGNAYVDDFYDSLREEPTLVFEIVKLLSPYLSRN